jgi:hypothetical protein
MPPLAPRRAAAASRAKSNVADRFKLAKKNRRTGQRNPMRRTPPPFSKLPGVGFLPWLRPLPHAARDASSFSRHEARKPLSVT